MRDVLEPLSSNQTGNNSSFDPHKETIKLTLRVICEAAFEYPDVTNEEIEQFTTYLEQALIEFDRNEQANPLRRYLTFFLPERQKAMRCCRHLQDFGLRILNHYRNNPNKSENNTVIRLLVNNPHLTSDPMKVAEILTFFVGGYDTVAFTLAAALLHLAKYPKVHEELRNSILSWKDDKDSNRTNNYLEYFIRENYRVLPVVALGSARVTGREFVVPPPPVWKGNSSEPSTSQATMDYETEEMVIPKGAVVLASQMIPNRSSLLFEDPDKFDPSRWENATPEQAAYIMPFAAGARNCIGQVLAKSELVTTLSMIVPSFSFEIQKEGTIQSTSTLKMKDTLLTPHKIH